MMSQQETDCESLGARITEPAGRLEVRRLPRRPKDEGAYWLQSPNGTADVTHRLFKFPAKFHVPVVRWALGTFGRRGSKVLDPFTGSGTVQLEAMRRGIASYGVDVDPLAVMVARVKTTPLNPRTLLPVVAQLKEGLRTVRRERGRVQDRPGADISRDAYRAATEGLNIPPILNIEHWFRRYVILDLALVKAAIKQLSTSRRISDFLLVCFASIVRRVSNADPSPVSGLEVTSVQAEKNPRRAISVVDTFLAKVEREVVQHVRLWKELGERGRRTTVEVLHGDALGLSAMDEGHDNDFPLVVTSPPYCRSVEYGRRHRLELFWLDCVLSGAEHRGLSHRYLGRNYVRVGDWDASTQFGLDELDGVIEEVEDRDPHRARAIHHYFAHMNMALREVKKVMKPSGTLVMVVGNSVCASVPIRTADYLASLMEGSFRLDYRFSYAIRNHHMQYGLWNGTGIKSEHVLVFKAR